MGVRIGVAGSMHHTEKMIELCDQLQRLGHEAFMSKFAGGYVGRSDEAKEELKLFHKYNNDAVREFWWAMQDAQALLVANYSRLGVEHYIGGNTFLEMGFAHVLGQQIYLINPIPDMPYYRTEIIAMRPAVIHGDLALIA
jgi:hypothetical protein